MRFRLVLVAFLAALPAVAQEQFAVLATGGKSMTSYHGQADLQSWNLEWTRRQWKHTDAGFSLGQEFLWQPKTWYGGHDHMDKEKVHAGNLSLVVRRYSASHPALFAEISSGPMWAGKQVPAATSRFNFLSQAGIGVLIGSRWATPITIGYRFAHISNAGFAHHNPGMNVSALVLGMRFRR